MSDLKFHSDGPPIEYGAEDGGDFSPHIGFAVNRWESLDEKIATMFTLIVDAKIPALPFRVFGGILNSSTRHDLLRLAVEVFLDRYNAPLLEKKISAFMDRLKDARGFRNRMIHGIVYLYVRPNESIKDSLGHWLLPAGYNTKHVTMIGEPRYHIGIPDIERFTEFLHGEINVAAKLQGDILTVRTQRPRTS